jgi:hypothetical protein
VGGDNQLLNQVVMQAPDVAQDSFGQFHVYGKQYGAEITANFTDEAHVFHFPESSTLTTRIDLINALDRVYEIRNGTGVGVGAPQFGPRRGLFFGISKSI